MTTFIFDVLSSLQQKGTRFSEITFILPSKRAGTVLRHELSKMVTKTIFSPNIISIEEFVALLSQLKKISTIELLFECYKSYCKITTKKEQEPFESFSKWAQILLQDFNEIDRYLIPHNKIFSYLTAVQSLNHWSLDENKTAFISNYLSFWNKLPKYYEEFSINLLQKKVGYQGLLYREAVENLEAYIQNNEDTKHVFLGFNALNTAEETIIKELLQNEMAEIYWDIDQHFMQNPIHDAALFTKQHKRNWSYFKTNPFNWLSSNYNNTKNIHSIGVPKNIGQAKQIGLLLNKIAKQDASLNNTAVILGDENLLIPVLNSIPKSIQALNITMGFPLKSIPLASLFEKLFILHKKTNATFYYKEVIGILSHQFIKPLFYNETQNHAINAIDIIHKNNVTRLNFSEIKTLLNFNTPLITILFGNWNNNTSNAIKHCIDLIFCIKKHLDKDKNNNLLALEYTFKFYNLFMTLVKLNDTYKYINNVATLFDIYKELLSNETLDFQGEALKGLQIMGMLESRVLDFETLIISSVNEGILPSGKNNNSFIPFDVKLENNLPTYKEKDAVYTYHFYRLLQRAKNVYVLYNTEIDTLNSGEKSRFITQLELEGIHKITHQIALPKTPLINEIVREVEKNDAILNKLIHFANKGFSPSSLTNYIRNPIDFYHEKILNINTLNEIEETVASNTLGTVVHNTLEHLYKPLENEYLTPFILDGMKSKINEKVAFFFKEEYKQGDITTGKNLIISEIAKRYVLNFINEEIKILKAGNTIKILKIEVEGNKLCLNIPELSYPIYLKGKVDRVDELNGVTRLIDYKSGMVKQNSLTIEHWEDITSDYTKYSKSFQVLCYALILNNNETLNSPIEAGIISFKNLQAGFLKFTKKEGKNKESLISNETLQAFEKQLKKLILEICNINLTFKEKAL